ncbi:MAG: hypothetical protein FWC50_03520 [Planctomycetaceae bacterium]|nr:hypothetical protein [Planctomycetaceae bacterium]
MTRKRKKSGIRRCQSCDDIIFMDGERMPGSSRLRCASCRYIEAGSKRRDRHVKYFDDPDDSDLDEYDYEMIGDPDFDLEEYLQ